MRGESKVGAGHRARTAVIYVRQSTLAQVRDHTESTARQYALAGEASRLGWPAGGIEVIDTDLGISGRSTEGRDGFKALVARVCLGEVGAIFELEISRLARSSADLSRRLELARLTDTLVIDADGIYDLAEFNDRLLLGLKGTMSEAELHLLAGRLQGAKRAAAERGELRTPLPVGYTRDEDGAVIINPDEQVSAAVAAVFATFTAAGSAYAVVGELAGSISMVTDRRRVESQVPSGALPRQVDALQTQTGQGPCLDSVYTRRRSGSGAVARLVGPASRATASPGQPRFDARGCRTRVGVNVGYTPTRRQVAPPHRVQIGL